MQRPRIYRPGSEAETTTVNIATTLPTKQWLKRRAAQLGITVSYLATQLFEAERLRTQDESAYDDRKAS